MIVGDLLAVVLVLYIVISAFVKCRKEGWGFIDYSLDRGFGLWIWFCIKLSVIVISAVYLGHRINWGFLNYKL